ncbi:MAG: cytochrome c biogenesis protein ResB [Odoribacter sp.]
MDFIYCPDISYFAFPVNLIAGVFLLLGIYTLHCYYRNTPIVKWLSGMSGTLTVTALLIILLVVEGIWALKLFRSWIFIGLEVLLLLNLGLVILQKRRNFTPRHLLFLANHAGLWLVLSAALLGAPDREEYKLIAPLNQTEYNAMDEYGHLHPLPFTVTLTRFDLQYYPTPNERVPRYFSSSLTLKSKDMQENVSIEVNHPADFKGYSLYQDSYDQKRGADSAYSVLLVVRDPWIGVVYVGIVLLLAGAVGLIISGPIRKEAEYDLG